MKKVKFIACVLAATTLSIAACNNEGDESANADSTAVNTTTTNETATTTNTSTNDYAAMAETYRTNSEAGVYLDARTGKSIRINVDPQTGRRTNAATGEPVWRYIDSKTWRVYGADSWDPLGEARLENGQVRYKGDNDAWMTYEERWPGDDTAYQAWKSKSADGTKTEVERDGDTKIKNENIKVKTEKDGDVKIKTEDGKKIKKDEDGVRVKNDNK